MPIFYILGMHILYVLIAVASIFNSKARFWIKGRKGLLKKIDKKINKNENIAWFHCASLGEFEQGRPVIEKFKEKYPEYKILLTFYSPSGFEIRKNYEKADYIYYLPIDTPRNAKVFVKTVNPKIVFFIKYEFWYYFLKEINKNQIPLYLVSGIFRKDQYFFKSYTRRPKKMLRFFTHFFVQNNLSKELMNSIGFNNVTISGDTRFDRVNEISKQTKSLELIEKFRSGALTLIAGSTWKPDEEILIKYLNETSFKVKFIIAPHEIHSENMRRIENSFKDEFNVLRYSAANENNIEQANILIIDSIGLLSSLYKYGDLAFIGGGFGKGIHNTLEAATFGLPILFGPNYLKFQEAIDLIEIKAAFSINSYNSLYEKLNNLLANSKLNEIGKKASEYVKDKCGATDKILSVIQTHKR